eukprot:426416-Rhodomonas_salina.1
MSASLRGVECAAWKGTWQGWNAAAVEHWKTLRGTVGLGLRLRLKSAQGMCQCPGRCHSASGQLPVTVEQPKTEVCLLRGQTPDTRALCERCLDSVDESSHRGAEL